MIRRARQLTWTGTLGLLAISALVITSLFAEFLAPYDPIGQDLRLGANAPGIARDGELHIFGTDALGRDILSRLIHGGRISLVVSLSSVLIGGVLGISLGLVAGYRGGTFDGVVGRLVDVQTSIPAILLILALIATVGPGLLNMIAVIGFSSWPLYARISRAEVLRLRGSEFVIAAITIGASERRILLQHVLANSLSPLIAIGTVEIGRRMITESTMSFLGVGVPAPTPSWGRMINEGRDFLFIAPWVSTFPGLAITFAVVGFALFGDFLRDYLDPRIRRR